MAAGEHVNVQVKHGLAGVWPSINNCPIIACSVVRYPGADSQQMSE